MTHNFWRNTRSAWTRRQRWRKLWRSLPGTRNTL